MAMASSLLSYYQDLPELYMPLTSKGPQACSLSYDQDDHYPPDLYVPLTRERPRAPIIRCADTLLTEYTMGTLIPTFKRQAKTKQFAVLQFLSAYDCATELKDVNFYPPVQVDSSHVSMPSKDDYDNYIVARYKGKKHAEKVLINELDDLYESYKIENEDSVPVCALMYSHLMPCTKCSELIIKAFSQPRFRYMPVIIIYTNPYDREDEEVAWESRHKFIREGFEVYQIQKDSTCIYSSL